MKSLFLVALIGLQFSTFATNRYISKQHTCEELKEIIANEKVIYLSSRDWIFSSIIYSNSRECWRRNKKPVIKTFKASDRWCKIRWGCDYINDDDE